MPVPGQTPRLVAVKILTEILGEGRLLSELLPAAVEKLTPEDRARAGRLATNTLRWMDRADRLLGPHLRKMPPLFAMNALRLAVVEICLDHAAAHGVVNSAVDIVRSNPKSRSMAGLVNAVLRKIAANGPEQWEKLPLPQMPKWLRKPLLADFGKPAIKAIEAAHAAGAPLDLTVKGDAQGWAKKLDGTALATGTVRLSGHRQVSALPGFETGDWWVQDAAAALPALLLAPKPGERVLDMCAAPGGKMLQLAQAGSDVTGIDVSQKRMERVRQNLNRTGLKATLVTGDVFAFDEGGFDAILLDAPCSATGTIRRHPDLPYAKDGSGFPVLFGLQERMLDHALTLLKPGGRLVYCTCSLLLDEGEEQIKDAMVRHSGLRVDRDALELPGIPPDWINEFGLRTRPDFWPDQGGIDGFFMTVMRNTAETSK